jgi:hypothetical protein
MDQQYPKGGGLKIGYSTLLRGHCNKENEAAINFEDFRQTKMESARLGIYVSTRDYLTGFAQKGQTWHWNITSFAV